MRKISEELAGIFEKIFRTIITPEDYGTDIRSMDLDSIAYIQFLAEIEDHFKVDFGYDILEKINSISIYTLSEYIEGKNKKDES